MPFLTRMIDTIKLGIPITEHQHTKLLKFLAEDESWQWVQHQKSSGEIRFMKLKGLAGLDQESFHREIFWDIPDRYTFNCTYLTLEFSIPKFWYGHNIHLLYDVEKALKAMKTLLEKQLHLRLPDVLQWRVTRVDVCYAWRCPSQAIAQQMLDSLKRLHYPGKKKRTEATTVMFIGKTYSVKFYLKLPEFLHHDKKLLLKSNASYEWIDSLEKKADAVLRYEATLRKKYLEHQNIRTVKDLVQPTLIVEFDNELISNHGEDLDDPTLGLGRVLSIINMHWVRTNRPDLTDSFIIDSYEAGKLDLLGVSPKPGNEYYAPAHKAFMWGEEIDFKGGGYKFGSRDNPKAILQYFLDKFLGAMRGMQPVDKVKAKLLEKYKPTKAARLLGFWLHVRSLGLEDAKALYNEKSYYRNKAELREAGVSLLEPVKVIQADQKFLETYRFEVPSPYVTNTVDDFRNSDNVLNIADWQNRPDRKPGRKS